MMPSLRAIFLIVLITYCGGCTSSSEPNSKFSSHTEAINQFVKNRQDAGWLKQWLQANSSEVSAFLEKMELKDCDEAFVLQQPALHAGELQITIACRKADQVSLRVALPSKNQPGVSQPIDLQRWIAFINKVNAWKALPKAEGLPALPVGWDKPTYEWAQGYVALLVIKHDHAWKVLPMRGFELLGTPQSNLRVEKSRWQIALGELFNVDFKQGDQEAEKFRQEQLAKNEYGRLFRYINFDERAEFDDALKAVKYLKRDSREMFDLVFWAIKKERDQMAAKILVAGTPLRQGAVAHPGLVDALNHEDSCSDCSLEDQQAYARRATDKLLHIIRLADLPAMRGKSALENFRAELEGLMLKQRALNKAEADRDKQVDGLAQKINAH